MTDMSPNQIIQGHALDILKMLPSESIHCCVTSPPYWGLRDYKLDPTIWDGQADCKHEWVKEPPRRERYEGDMGKDSIQANHPAGSPNLLYTDSCSICGGWRGSLGLEPTPELYVQHLIQVFREVKRVLRSDGTFWMNMGDTYNSAPGGYYPCGEFDRPSRADHRGERKPLRSQELKPKDLCGIPWMVAFALRNDGWYLRSDIIWSKPNPMPESVTDRPTKSHEYIFMFAKSGESQYWTNEKTGWLVSLRPLGTKGIEGVDWEWRELAGEQVKRSLWMGHDYFFDQDAVREPSMSKDPTSVGRPQRDTRETHILGGGNSGINLAKQHAREQGGFTGRNIRSVWTMADDHAFVDWVIEHYPDIFGEFGERMQDNKDVWNITTQPYPDAHFATFPEALVEPMIKAGCPAQVCQKCGKPRERIVEVSRSFESGSGRSHRKPHGKMAGGVQSEGSLEDDIRAGPTVATKTVGWTDCRCGVGFDPGIVLDPFCGSGTACLVAAKLNRSWIGIDLNPEYVKMAEKRVAPYANKLTQFT